MQRRRLSPTGIILFITVVALLGTVAQGRAAADPQAGRELFAGSRAFANGGAPCLACHSIAGAGLGKAAGASYGPDLTSMYEGFGEEGVAEVLETLPFTSMEPIYANRPLTEAERADLAAFLQVVGGEPPQVGGHLAAEVAIGTAALLLIAGFFGRKRLRGVRQALVNQSTK